MASVVKNFGQGVGDTVAAVESGAVGKGFKGGMNDRGFHF
jgi:hypothetical protein